MSVSSSDVLAWICGGLMATTVLHAAVVAAVLNLRRIEEESDPGAATSTPPITWFRPLKGGVPELREKLACFLAGIRESDQVIFGVDPGSPEFTLCAAFEKEHPGKVVIVTCDTAFVPNPKISKLIQMAPLARHSNWAVVDAEAIMDRAFLETYRSEWKEGEILTAGYQFDRAKTLPQQLDALSVLLTLWPGLELIRMFSRFRFTLGACTAMRREDVESIGGWEAFGHLLAEDNALGRSLSARGKKIRLSRAVLALDSDPMNWRAYWCHQVRVAVTYRAADPLGTAGLIFTRGISAGLLLWLIHPRAESLVLLMAVWAIRVALAVRIARQVGATSSRVLWTVPLADIVETAAWVVNWFVREVWWGGQYRRITFRGRLVE